MVFEAVLQYIKNGASLLDLSSTILPTFNNNVEQLKDHLLYAGFIPEEFEHDSSEEKSYAKYCEVLICSFLHHLKFDSKLIEARGNRADVVAICNSYRVIADAKAFRMTRTALNPKDYKINAMDKWRKPDNAKYTFLVSSIFPGASSRLWSEAVLNNVLILSYAHLYHLLINKDRLTPESIENLFIINDIDLSGTNQIGKKYWGEINKRINKISPNFKFTQKLFVDSLTKQRERAIGYWNARKDEILNMEEMEAKKLIIEQYYNISNKINLIRDKHFFFD